MKALGLVYHLLAVRALRLEESRVGFRRAPAVVTLCPRYCRLEKLMGEIDGECRRYEVLCRGRLDKLPVLDDVFNWSIFSWVVESRPTWSESNIYCPVDATLLHLGGRFVGVVLKLSEGVRH